MWQQPGSSGISPVQCLLGMVNVAAAWELRDQVCAVSLFPLQNAPVPNACVLSCAAGSSVP